MELEEDTESKFNPDETDVKQNEPMLNVQFIKCEQQAVMHEEIEDNYNLSSLECLDIKEEYDHSLQNAEDLMLEETEEVEMGLYSCNKLYYNVGKEENSHLQQTGVLVGKIEDMHGEDGIQYFQDNSREMKDLKLRERYKYFQKRTGDHKILHQDNFLFSCEVCGKPYRIKSKLNTHVRIHTGERFSCSMCRKSFVHKFSLKSHINLHLPPEMCWKNKSSDPMSLDSIEPYICEICGNYFALKCSLNRHMKLHANMHFSCDFCKRSFRAKGYLRVHMRTHADQY